MAGWEKTAGTMEWRQNTMMYCRSIKQIKLKTQPNVFEVSRACEIRFPLLRLTRLRSELQMAVKYVTHWISSIQIFFLYFCNHIWLSNCDSKVISEVQCSCRMFKVAQQCYLSIDKKIPNNVGF